MQLMSRTAPRPFSLPPPADTAPMKLTQTQQPPHLVPLLELLEADDALLRLALLAHTVLLRRLVHQHAVAGRHPPRPRALGARRSGRTADTTIATTTATAAAATATTTARPVSRRHPPCPYPSRSSSSTPTPRPGRRPGSRPRPRKMRPNALHHMLLALRLPAIEPTRGEFVSANRTLVLLGDLALRLLLLLWLLVRLRRSQGCRGRGWR